MGASPRLEVVAGVLLGKNALYVSAGEAWACLNGHPREQPNWFACPKDGIRFEYREIEVETDLYRRLLSAAGGDVDKLYCRSGERGGLHELYRTDSADAPTVLGVSPRRTYDETRIREFGDAYLYVLPPAEVIDLIEEATKLCRSLGVEGEVKLYVCGSISW